jgi:phenylpropionate dioxygenase-like ring-hydroxylating dioxygenase large terminal subunit
MTSDPDDNIETVAGAPEANAATGGTDYALRDLWYYALPASALGTGKLVARTILGEDLVFGRDTQGAPFALADVCPHRGIPLRFGTFDGKEVQCCYHGWRFAPDGRLTCVPSLVAGQSFDFNRVRVGSYPCREADGNVWIYVGKDRAQADALDIPRLPDLGAANFHRLYESQLFACPMDHAVMGLMDPAHGPFVHSSWWWRPPATAHEKAKHFAPSDLGFTMVRHAPSSNSRLYRLLGGKPETEISFRLPGVRIEHIRAGRHHIVSLTGVTPQGPKETLVHQAIYWTIPWMSAFKPVLAGLMTRFLGQDRDIVTKQQLGLRHNPPLRLIDDADTPAKWYLRLKREYARSRAEGRPFVNPVPDTVLRWKS